jgi:hypothetical protein
VLAYWKEIDAFKKQNELTKDKKPYTFKHSTMALPSIWIKSINLTALLAEYKREELNNND